MTVRRTALGLALVAASAGCRTAPAGTIPEPFPETLEWAVAGRGEGAFLGLETRENDSGSLDDLSFEPGVRVVGVVEQSPAAQAGFRIGDVVIAYDGHLVDDPGALRALVDESAAGTPVRVDVRRGDTVFDVTVQVREAAATDAVPPEVLYRVDPARSAAGWATGRGGVVLVSSHEEAPFPAAGVPVGSVVLAVDERETKSDRALIRTLAALEPGATVDVDYLAPGEDAPRSASVRLLHVPRRVTRFKFPILWHYAADPEGTEVDFTLVDLWLVWLFRYERDGEERRWSLLRFFRFESGIGELHS